MTEYRVTRCWIEVAVCIAIVLLAAILLLPAVQQAREAARRTMVKNDLIQIGLALGGYHESYRMLPYGGIFREDGTAVHSWDTALFLYLSQRSYVDAPDSNFPWDDPVNIDHFMHEATFPWQVPGISKVKSPDGLPLTHLAANQSLFYRNSVVQLDHLPEKSSIVLVGQAQGNFVPIGYPYNWRDLSLGLGKSDDGFGFQGRRSTKFVMADMSVREFSNDTHPDILRVMSGPTSSNLDAMAKPGGAYRLTSHEYWRYLSIVRCHKGLMTFRLSPNQKSLHVNFGQYDDPADARPERWNSYFQQFLDGAPVERVQLSGRLLARELQPFMELPNLKHLTISSAYIEGDPSELLKASRSETIVD